MFVCQLALSRISSFVVIEDCPKLKESLPLVWSDTRVFGVCSTVSGRFTAKRAHFGARRDQCAPAKCGVLCVEYGSRQLCGLCQVPLPGCPLLTCAHPSCAQPAACEMRARVDIAVQRSDEEWRALLTAEEYRVLRKCGTEAYGKV